MAKNVFVLGLTDLQRAELATVPGADSYRVHGLLDYESLVTPEHYDFEAILERARAELAAADGTVDAIVCHWDFPSSVLAPVLAHEHGIPAPSLRSVMACEHKYWSRLEQQASVPECVPRFAAFDPFADDPLTEVDLDFPFWVKPVKAHSSALGFEIRDAEEFQGALVRIREQIGYVGNAFDQALKHVDLPEEVARVGGNTCLAEQVITGIQAAPEGSISEGAFHVHGVFDMHKDEYGHSIARLDYPAHTVPEDVQQRMIDVAARYLHHIGFDNGAFNIEYMWDRDTDALWLIEVNTRISQSHSDLFAKVDGASNHEVAIDLALGQRPTMPHRQGRYGVASKCAIFHDTDGVVAALPTEAEVEAVRERFPDTRFSWHASVGDRLSDLPHQDSYRYIVGDVYLGADDREQLLQRYNEILAMVTIEYEPAGGESA